MIQADCKRGMGASLFFFLLFSLKNKLKHAWFFVEALFFFNGMF